jgi:chromosome segregation protein
MYLKSLKLVGFKSFADRTRLEFRPGVTVVVGPNGSGKSNIVDAVAWVMGTQSTRALRTGKMEDVIFAGTATRPGLGRAEVTLILDNASGTLPLDLPEVSVTRRLYRDGSSDYEINGVACRLLDVQELLSDSGVGRHQHVIVGQGQIDSVLNAGPEDHRAVIEEAAGILKHRTRKDRAERRLERSDGDVVRLRDLLAEMGRQMRPLRRQAEAAARHDGLAAEVRALRLHLGGDELRRLDAEAAGAGGERVLLTDRSALASAESEELASALALLTDEAGEAGRLLDRDTATAARLETTLERLRRIAQVSHERRRAALSRSEGEADRRRDLEAERDELTATLAQGEVDLQQALAVSERAERVLRTLEEEERSLAGQEGMSVEGALAAARGELGALESADDRDAREATSLDQRGEVLDRSIEEDGRGIERIQEEIRDLDALVGEAQTRYRQASERRAIDQSSWEQAEARHNEARVSEAAAAAAVEAVEQAMAGRADPVARSMVEQAPGARGAAVARLDVPAGLEPAVDAALGPWSDAVAFEERDGVEGAVAELKGSGRGGVPVVASGAIGPAVDARDIARQWGLEALVDRLGPAADPGLTGALLGDVVLAEGWSTAWQLVERHPEIRVVTPEGDLVTVHGIRVGVPDGVTPAMLETAQVTLERATTDRARAASLLTTARRAFEAARQVERDALETLERLEAELGGAAEALARLERSRVGSQDERAQLRRRSEAMGESRAGRSEQMQRLRVRLQTLEGEEAERQSAWEAIADRRRQVGMLREQARTHWQEATAAVRAVEERRRFLRERLETVEAGLISVDEGTDTVVDVDRLEVLEAMARRALTTVRARLEELRGRQAQLRTRASLVGARLELVGGRHRELQSVLVTAGDRLNQLAVRTAELRVRREAVAEALRRDLDASEEEALAAPVPAHEEGTDLAARLAAREAELRRMGPVNPLAAAEYGELSERHAFLEAQLEDLERSREELRKVIRAIDEEIERRFMEAFAEVATGYEEYFALLFPGGRGRLVLTDPDAALTSGVDIEAQPLGKKISRMSLLSGGERSLAALAFLFAVFRARPSPFYLLDEVEAALDDANLRRFLRLLERFRSDAQLLVVTHQQQTMETADVLYGVTMEPGGSSRVVAKALEPSVSVQG